MERPSTTAMLAELKKVRRIFSPPDLRESVIHRKIRAGIAMEVRDFFHKRHSLKIKGEKVGRRACNIYLRKLIVDKLRESAFVYSGK